MNCANCENFTTNAKFCNRSCSVTFNNRVPKRKAKIWTCSRCKIVYEKNFWGGNHCLNCKLETQQKREKILERTMGEIRENYQSSVAHPSTFFSEIRQLARRMNSHRPNVCQECGYSKHVECAHVVSLSKIPDHWTLRMINDPSNVLKLCRNHHWEFDNGFPLECTKLARSVGIEPTCTVLETTLIPDHSA